MTARLSDVDLLARLVSFDTTSRNSNLPIADFIGEYLDRSSVSILQNPSPDGTKTNLVVITGNGDPGAGLLLSGHMDVVPADEDDWESDPFTLTERDGGLCGRGACDMKGFLAIVINRMAAVDSGRLRNTLALLLTYDEECGTLGARHFVETWSDAHPLPTDAIIGEPTSLRVVRMHKGFLEMRVTLAGTAAHSGYPHLGVSAIEPAGEVIRALVALRQELEDERPLYSDRFPEVPYAALNIGRVEGGTAINVVPDGCVVEIGIRIMPAMASEEIAERVREAVQRALGSFPFELETLSDSPPMWLDEDTPVLEELCRRAGETDPGTVSYATDAGWLQTAGHRCIIFGPGSIHVAHKPNEYVPVGELAQAAEIIDGVISFCCL